MAEPGGSDLRVVSIDDERSEVARAAFELVHEAMWDVQPTDDLLSELEEKRRGMPSGGDYHLLALVDGEGAPVAVAAGVYLEAVNAGFVTYLAVRADQRGRRLGRELRGHLIDAFRAEALRRRGQELAWVVGEVRRESPWLRTLVALGRAIPFDLRYFHPWMPRRAERVYVLYREPVGDTRPELPAAEVGGLLYAIWRRAYRIRYPLQSDTFCFMLSQLEGRDTIGPDPEFGPAE
jgi:GNAT superfamily N-acetyltransferase